MKRANRAVLFFLFLIVLGSAGAAAAGTSPYAEAGPGEIGILAGAGFHDRDLNSSGEEGIGPLAGARLAYRLVPHLGWFADYTWSTFTPRFHTLQSNVNVAVGRSGLEYWVCGKADAPWDAFLAAAGGVMDVSYSTDVSTYRPALVSLGVGVQRRLSDHFALRVGFRADHTVNNDHDVILSDTFRTVYGTDLSTYRQEHRRIGADVNDYQATVGLSLLLGGPPRDSDGDGVPDKADLCPDTPHGWPVDAHGCPLDSDGDGVPDGIDQCPNTPKGATVDAKGCPLDSDGDGVPDGIDQCPNTPSGATVDARGCPLDSDGDGVPDGIDQCPNTPKGTPVDAKGCPLPPPPPPPPKPAPAPIFQPGKKSLILQGVNFETGKAVLTPGSEAVLNKVVASLKDWPDVRVEVGGHTDSTGRPETNLTLSRARAQAVVDYLVSAGIDPSRLTAKGYGSSKPIADNSTPEGRAQNRRVELTKID